MIEMAILTPVIDLAEKNSKNYVITLWQHDGLIVKGTIPMELIHNARRFSGLPYADLEEKSIH